jgi:hypothetical protein
MPLTFTLTEGVLPKGSEKAAFQKLCEAMLSWHGLQGNQVMTPNVVGSIQLFPRELPRDKTQNRSFATAALDVLRVIQAHQKTGINMKYPMTCKPHGKTNQ